MVDGADSVEVVGVVGAGVIGASWAALFLAAGKEVDLFDPAPTAEADTRAYIDKAWPSLVELGLVRAGATPERIRFCADAAAAVARAGFVQESVPERLPLKLETYREIEPALAPGALVATSSSGLLLTDLQEGWRDPGPLVLGHPFNPPHLIPLVELLANERTGAGVLERVEAVYRDRGKVTIRMRKEIPGHVANRLQAALWREAVHLVAEGVASLEDVDTAISAGPGLRWAVMGPHMLFSLAAGERGFEAFCARYGESFHAWWDSLGEPRLTEEVAGVLAEGIAEARHGRSFEQLAAERDGKLVAALTALARAGDAT